MALLLLDSGAQEALGDSSIGVVPTENLDHCDEGVARFISQFQDKPRLSALLCAFLNQVQELEVAIFDLITERVIGFAIGAQLDILGDIVGQERLAFGDTDFRTLIRARIKVNRSDGQPEQLLEILRLVLLDTPAPEIKIAEFFPASVHLCVPTELTFDADIINSLLQAAKATAVLLIFKFTLSPKAKTFTFAPGSIVVIDADKGFADETQTSGGTFAGALD